MLDGRRPIDFAPNDSPLGRWLQEQAAAACKAADELCAAAKAGDLARVHARDLVEKATASYPTDEAATAALGLDSDTYFSASASGYAALMSAGSVTELTTRVAQVSA